MALRTENEFGNVDFGDDRLNRRFAIIVEQLSQNAGQLINLACEDWAATKAAYRFFDNSKVSPTQISNAHVQATLRRAELQISNTEETLLVIQDTTYLNYSHHPSTTGLGEISGWKDRNPGGGKMEVSGLLLHSSLALTTEGVPLGFLDQKLWTRTKPIGLITKSKKNMTRIPIEQKESFRWLEAMRNVATAISKPSQVIHIGDRESDIFEFFHEAREQKSNFLVRIRDAQRGLSDGGRIFDPLEDVSRKGTFKIHVKNKNGKSRVVTMEVKYYFAYILPSASKKHLPAIPAHVITVREVAPPNGEDQIVWNLLTNLRITSFRDALQKIKWYEMRWNIDICQPNYPLCSLSSSDALAA